MLTRTEYEKLRLRNQSDFTDGAAELRDALIAVPPAERARLLGDNPGILARIPTPALRAEVLLIGTALSVVGERAVMSVLESPDVPPHRAAAVTAAMLPPPIPPTAMITPPKRPRSGPTVVTPRHRVSNRWLRSWFGLGRPVQAAALVLVATFGINGWHIGKAATAHDVLPPGAVFHQAGTWPPCSDGLRQRTDFCVYPVARSLDWHHAMADLRATDEEQRILMTVNKPLLETTASWPPDTLLVVWRGKRPETRR